MKRMRYSAEQIVYALRQAEAGSAVVEICRKLGVSEQTSSCLAKGCIQAEVLPLPTAPKMAMPVYSPRSGMVSHSGLKISLGSTG